MPKNLKTSTDDEPFLIPCPQCGELMELGAGREVLHPDNTLYLRVCSIDCQFEAEDDLTGGTIGCY